MACDIDAAIFNGRAALDAYKCRSIDISAEFLADTRPPRCRQLDIPAALLAAAHVAKSLPQQRESMVAPHFAADAR